ncbi:MAG: glycosyltransferase family protein [Schleiferiaceae bacterium]
MKILYAFQGTGNGHVARARDLVPRFKKYADVDVLVAGTQSDLDLGLNITYRLYGLTMVYNKKGAVSYWQSALQNKPFRFIRDVFNLPVNKYEAVIVDFEAVTSYACLIRGVKSLQLSHQAAYWSKRTPRPERRIWHWEFVIAYMSPSKFRLGFHFSRYDDFILPPIIRREIRGAALENKGHYTVYLPSYHPEEIVSFVNQFQSHRFHIFARVQESYHAGNAYVQTIGVDAYLESFRTCEGLICGAGFEAPSEAIYCGKKLLISPIKDQYEQAANAKGAQLLGIDVFESLDADGAIIWSKFLSSKDAVRMEYPDYAEALVKRIVKNVEEGNEYDDISSLEVW